MLYSAYGRNFHPFFHQNDMRAYQADIPKYRTISGGINIKTGLGGLPRYPGLEGSGARFPENIDAWTAAPDQESDNG